MLKKFCAVLFFALVIQGNLYAENSPEDNPYQYRRRRTYDYWFVTGSIGGQVYFGDHDKQESISKRIVPKYEANIGKWFNESFGFRLGVNTGKIKGLTQDVNLKTSEKYVVPNHWLYRHEYNYVNVHADILFNWTNDVESLHRDFSYHIVPYVGLGWSSAWDKPKVSIFSPNLGFIQTYKLDDKVSLHLDIRGNLYGDRFDGEKGGNKFEGTASALLGLSYSFK